MFSEELLIKIFTDKDTRRVPLVYQSTMIHVIERILDDTDTNECRNKDSNVG